MFSEAVFHKREHAGKISEPAATSQTEVAEYIASLSSELQSVAQKSGFGLLAYLLSMVTLHARELAKEENPDRPEGPSAGKA